MIEYAKKNLIVGFSYKKVHDLIVSEGNVLSVREEPSGVDTRYNLFSETFCKITGSQFYGYSASPSSAFLSVNGYDEICNSIAGEDYNYGIRVEKAGNEIYYSKRVLFYETEDIIEEVSFLRRDPLVSDEAYKGLMRRFNIIERWDPNGRTDISHLTLDMLMRDKTWTEGNDYNLSELRNRVLGGGSFPVVLDPEMRSIEGVLLRDIE